jgi:hypothetical protein
MILETSRVATKSGDLPRLNQAIPSFLSQDHVVNSSDQFFTVIRKLPSKQQFPLTVGIIGTRFDFCA